MKTWFVLNNVSWFALKFLKTWTCFCLLSSWRSLFFYSGSDYVIWSLNFSNFFIFIWWKCSSYSILIGENMVIWQSVFRYMKTLRRSYPCLEWSNSFKDNFLRGIFYLSLFQSCSRSDLQRSWLPIILILSRTFASRISLS